MSQPMNKMALPYPMRMAILVILQLVKSTHHRSSMSVIKDYNLRISLTIFQNIKHTCLLFRNNIIRVTLNLNGTVDLLVHNVSQTKFIR